MPTCEIIAGPNGAGKTSFSLNTYRKERVVHGGHNIPASDIERRFSRSLYNLLNEYSHCVNYCSCFMNYGEKPELVFEQRGDSRTVGHHADCQLPTQAAQS